MAPSSSVRPSTPSRSGFALVGRSTVLDSRFNAVRRDLADLRLAGQVFAPHYARAMPRTALARADIVDDSGRPLSELLVGETFEVLEIAGDRAWGRAVVDCVVGSVAFAALGEARSDVVVPLQRDDWVATAEALVGVPVRPGGRSADGIDGPGLVFVALSSGGLAAPRFTPEQRQVGRLLTADEPTARGDLLVFDDAVAVAVGSDGAIDAPDGGEPVAVVPLATLVERLGPVTARRRPA